jgi:hypothetical protein
MSRLAVELDRGKIRYRRSGLFTKKQKKQETKDERCISRYIITIELEHSNNHWQRASIEREKKHRNSQHISEHWLEEIPYGHRVTTSQFLSRTIIL